MMCFCNGSRSVRLTFKELLNASLLNYRPPIKKHERRPYFFHLDAQLIPQALHIVKDGLLVVTCFCGQRVERRACLLYTSDAADE